MGYLTVSWTPLWNASLVGLALFILALIYDFAKHRRRQPGSPPGPFPLPFVGNMFLMDFNDFPKRLSKLSRRYGNVFSIQIFWEKMVVLNGYEAVKEALITKSEDTADRPSLPIFEHLGFHNGIAFSGYNKRWKEQRRFALTTLKNFGMGRKSVEERIREEAAYLCSAFQAKEGQPFDPFLLVNNAVSNVICSIVFGDHYDYNNKTFQRLLILFREVLELQTGFLPQMINIFPWLTRIPGPHQKMFAGQNTLLDFIRGIIKEHRDTWDPAITRDFIDAFLEEMEKAKGDPQSSFTETSLLYATNDLFVAGTDTTANTLRWSILLMLLYPQIQRQVHNEIDRVIGRDGIPTSEDQVNMPFTSAVIHETQRYGNILPTSLLHMARKDTIIQGFHISKGTTIIPNMTSVLKDEKIWEKPYQFYPKHFLDSEGHFVKRDAFLPFSAGRRLCVGEQLARKELFLFFTSLLQRFDFEIPQDQPQPREDPVFMFFYCTRPYQICAKLR
ncbi:cytochrome P450 2D15-like [Discoglossus pictus]